MKYYLYNSKANNGIKPKLPRGAEIVDALGLDYKNFFAGLNAEDEVVIVGGDGTINYFINALDTDEIKNNVYFLGAGTGNDFLLDINCNTGSEILLNEYMHNLPTVFVNGLEKKFINGIGYGIDGYCCEVADRQKAKTPNKKINYTGIALGGLLCFFKPKKARITVDGNTRVYNNVWMAPTMKGRYFGGGMMVAPGQDRKDEDVSVVVCSYSSRLGVLYNFPSIFKGEHVKRTDMITTIKGKEIEVGFDKPCALQIDGETVLNVLSYKVKV